MESAQVVQAILVAGMTIAVCLWLRSRFGHSQSAAQLQPEPRSLKQTQASGQWGVHLRRVNLLSEEESETSTDIDIIAIHGLDTKSPDTWIWKKGLKDPTQRDVNWLADQDMLPNRVGRARIFTCDWPADLFDTSDLSQKTLEELARRLLDSVKRRPNAHVTEDRPILFIASCLGGIILMKALVMADGDYLSVRRATRGVIFLATPFQGTSFQYVARWAEPGLKAWARIRGQKVTKLLESLKGPTFTLNQLVRDFTQLCQSQPYQVTTFYEKGFTNLYYKISPWLPVPFYQEKQLVDESSGTLQIVKDPLPLDRPHVLMNKFNGPKDPDFQAVSGKVEDFLREIREGTVLAADNWIRDEYYAKGRLEIERLSGESLPMGRCYINLVIVKQPGENTHCLQDKFKEGSEGDAVPKSSPFSLSERLKVETPQKELQIELPVLFDPRKTPDGHTKDPKRILIRGRAGVGKTTLCKKIVHDFVYNGMWKSLFDRVLWVPLRKLKELSPREYNYRDLFHYIYFAGLPENLCLADALWRAIDSKATYNRGTLFLLDGLDEVSELLDSTHRASSILTMLLNNPNVIITTRPHAKFPSGFGKPGLELETIGFYPGQVQDYLRTVVQDSQKVEEIQSFLQNHRLVQSLVRIPIQLDALCLAWDEDFNGNSIRETMTAIYEAIVQRLWKKDITRFSDKTKSSVRDAHRSEIEDAIENENRVLEHLAFSGLYSNVIEFQPEHRDAICQQFKSPGAGFLLDPRLGCLSFMRTSEPSADALKRSYHFIHLTFQEFFAAKYFARQWKTRENLQYVAFNERGGEKFEIDPVNFLQRFKYTARYDIVWRFTAGLLKSKEISDFFNKIEKRPLDLLGPTHQRLVMHCLSEVDSSTDLPIRSNLEGKLLQWLLFECDVTGDSILAREPDFPDQVLRTAVETDSGRGRVRILRALQYPRAHLSKATMAAVIALFKHKDRFIRSAAAEALGYQSNLSEATIAAVVALLKDKDYLVQSAAAEALRYQSNFSEASVAAVVVLLKHEHNFVRSAAAKTLGHRSSLSEAAVETFVALVNDKDQTVRFAAAEILGGQSILSEATIAAVVGLLKDKRWFVRSAAAQALGRQSNLSEATLAAVIELLKDKTNRVRSAAAEALGRQSNLSESTVAAVIELLKDKINRVRSAATEALGRQSNLSEPTVAAVVELLKDKVDRVRYVASKALRRQSNLSEATVAAVVELLQNKDDRVRYAAAGALWGQSDLSEATVKGFVELLKDKDDNVRYAAFGTLGRQSNLSEATVAAVVELLQNKDENVRHAAVETLGYQSDLSEATMKGFVELLKDKHENVRHAVAEALWCQLSLSDATVAAVVALLKNKNCHVRHIAAETLGCQSKLLEATMTAIVAVLKDKDKDIRFAASEALGCKSNLLDKILEAAGLMIDSERVAKTKSSTLYKPQFVNSLYGSLLHRSFREQLSLCQGLGRAQDREP